MFASPVKPSVSLIREYTSMPKFGVRILGLFIPVLREFVEMMYQFENDYIFDSSKAEKFMGTTATPYEEGIAATMGK